MEQPFRQIFSANLKMFHQVNVKSKNNLNSHLAPDVFVDQMVLAFVVKDDVHLLRPGPTNVRT